MQCEQQIKVGNVAPRDDSQDEIELSELLCGLRSHLWIVLVCVLCGAAFCKLLERPAVFEARAEFDTSVSRMVSAGWTEAQPQFDDPIIDLMVSSRFAEGVFEEMTALGSAGFLTGRAVGAGATTDAAGARNEEADSAALSQFLDFYRTSVSNGRTASEAVEVSVSHPDPSTAAMLANVILGNVLTVIPQEWSVRAEVWMEEASRTIAGAGIRRDDASRALTLALEA